MKRYKKTLVWLSVFSLILGLFPASLIFSETAHAADPSWTPPTYFIPDDVKLQSTSSLDLSGKGSDISELVKGSSSASFKVDGIFSQVSTNLEATVQQLNYNGTSWQADATRIVTDKITDSGNGRFTVNLKLFQGYNKITLSGYQGNNKRTDTFYVLYDRVPTLLNAQILGSGSNAISLNEDARAVVTSNRVMVKGQVENATKVSFYVNGGTDKQLSTVIDKGDYYDFFSSYLYLEPGLNTLTIEIENDTSKITATRLVYFFDENQPFVELNLTHAGYSTPLDLLTQVPTVAKIPAEAGISGQVLLPYKSAEFKDPNNHELTVSVDRGLAQTLNVSVDEEITIPGPDGVSPAYRLVKFTTTDKFSFTVPKGTMDIDVTVKYGDKPDNTYKAAKRASFKYLPGEKVIKNMYLLPEYDGATLTIADLDKIKVPLKNAQISSSDFYILVEGEEAVTVSPELIGTYLPLSTTTFRPKHIGETGTNMAVYKVEGFATGNQQVRFYFDGSTAYYTVNISNVSRSKIHVDNVVSGQVFEIDSRVGDTIKITGKYSGFGNVTNYHNQVIINGVEKFPNNAGTWLDTANGTFSLELDVDNNGPLYYGQNTIVFSGQTAGNSPTIVTETLRFYIIDKNVSIIDKFIPVAAPKVSADRIVFQESFQDNKDNLNKIFEQSTDFTPNTEGFVTGRKSYDLVLQGGGAEKIELYQGTKLFFSMDIATDEATNHKVGYTTPDGLVYDFSGNKDQFILRIRDVQFEGDTTYSHTYNLDLINRTGSRTSQKLVITREVSAFRIIAPQPTVENKIIVNRNFVRFDIEAEGATSVTIGKDQATKRKDLDQGAASRFIYDYVGLKKDAWNTIKMVIDRNGVKTSAQVQVYYSSAVAVDSQYMAEKVSNKYSVFNKQLELSFPKGTVLKNEVVPANSVVKFYPDNKLLFGIADPSDGVVERKNDYGNIIFDPNSGETSGYRVIGKPDFEVSMFRLDANTFNFTPISDVYWISAGIAEDGNSPSSNGIPPYSPWYSYPSVDSNQPVSYMGIDATRRLVPTQRGKLTLAYNSSVVDAAGTTVTVFRLNARGLWENIGGEVNTKNHTITVPFDEFGYYKVMKLKSSYKDITDHGWARDILNALYAKGIMNNNGLRSDSFGTDDPIERGEFATLIVKGLNLPLKYDDNQTFFDVVPTAKTNTWSYEYIETAARAGIINGLGDGYFGVTDQLTREQAAVMIARALKLKLAANDSKLEATLSKSFLDSGKIDLYARPSVQAVNSAKIMTGAPVKIEGQKKAQYNFNPKSPITRAEAGKIAVELLKKSTNIFPKNLS